MIADHADILLVHDNPLEVELMLRPLRELASRHPIGVARDGEEALDYLLARGPFRHRLGAPLPRLVLLDLKLPKMDGAEVVRALRTTHRTSSVPIVVLVPASEPREIAQCYQVGANSCVLKPVRFPEFYAVMKSVGEYWLGVNQAPAMAGGQTGGWTDGQ
jgi:two-component system response regulator